MAAISNDDRSEARKRGEYGLIALLVGALVGLCLILAFAFGTHAPLTVFGNATMLAAASALAGGLLGFIFGIPRTMQQAERGDAETQSRPSQNQFVGYGANTNLEQISDWLTKILVGAGLTQIANVRTWLREAGIALAPGFGGSEAAQSFATATVLAYVLTGFLVGYLWTRLYFAGALRQADVEALAREVHEIREQTELDARAMALVLAQLNPGDTTTTPTQEELNAAAREAGPNTRDQIYQMAAEKRYEGWVNLSKPKLESVIPVFQALLESEKDDQKQRLNNFQLTAALWGLALKSGQTSDWHKVEEQAVKSIEMRGPSTDRTWLQLELARATSRIMLDEHFKRNEASTEQARAQILEDLRKSIGWNPDAFLSESANDPVKHWLTLNGVLSAQLASEAAHSDHRQKMVQNVSTKSPSSSAPRKIS